MTESKNEITPSPPENESFLYHETSSETFYEFGAHSVPKGPAWFALGEPVSKISPRFVGAKNLKIFARILVFKWKNLKNLPNLVDISGAFTITDSWKLLASKMNHLIDINNVSLSGRASILDRVDEKTRNIILDWLATNKYDGIFEKENSIVLLQPEKWLKYDHTELFPDSFLEQDAKYDFLAKILPLYSKAIKDKDRPNIQKHLKRLQDIVPRDLVFLLTTSNNNL
jgi:hypothetical protein